MSKNNNSGIPRQGVLFDAQEMYRIEEGTFWSEQKGQKAIPVTVLGHTFKNDDERREWFREELRKRLPQLRQVEGFPIGSDDDIIRLSDPPYYTACPNPWLNDFIAEWEQEKQSLVKEGKREADKEVAEPYASDVREGKNNPVYTAHTYHTKVPHPAIMRYILYYTQPGDIVLDGFAGTGMTGVAAASCSIGTDAIASRINGEWEKNFGKRPNWGERHAICGDLSPYAANIAYFYNTPFDIQALKREVARIKKEMDDECGWMYTTTDSKGQPNGRISFVVWSDIMVCPHCGQEYVFWNQVVDNENQCMRDTFVCPHCGASQTKRTAHPAVETYYDEALNKIMERIKQVPVIVVGKSGKTKIQRAPNEYDLEVLKRIENEKITDFFPTDELPEGYNTEQPKKTRHIFHVHQFYTKRNLIALSKLHHKIESSPMASILRFMFTGMIHRSASMQRVIIGYYFHGGGGWNGAHLKGTLYIPNIPTETSVLEQIDDKLGAMVRAEEMLANVRPNALYVGSADDLQIKDNSVDYIFTDPPFGANINYSELNSLPEPWLRVITNNSDEAIENPAQGKTADTYRDTMTRCFAEYFRVLKPGKWMTVEFSNTSAAVWNLIQNALQRAGFVVASVSALDKKQGSFKAVTTTTAVKQDLVISCFKPSQRLLDKFSVNADATASLWDFVDDLISHLSVYKPKGEGMTTVAERTPQIIYDKVISYYVLHGYPIPIDAGAFQQELERHYTRIDGMYFTPEDAVRYKQKKLSLPEFHDLGIVVSNESNGIQWLHNQLRNAPKTYQEIQPEWLKAIYGVRKGEVLPELRTLLEENFIEMDDGRWREPNVHDGTDKDVMRTKELLKIFKQYVAVAKLPKGKLPCVRTEALRAGFKQCYIDKDFKTILQVCDKIPQDIRDGDAAISQFYGIALNKV